jgi:hypothetical protein
MNRARIHRRFPQKHIRAATAELGFLGRAARIFKCQSLLSGKMKSRLNRPPDRVINHEQNYRADYRDRQAVKVHSGHA